MGGVDFGLQSETNFPFIRNALVVLLSALPCWHSGVLMAWVSLTHHWNFCHLSPS